MIVSDPAPARPAAPAAPAFLGEAQELGEITLSFLEESHALTVALAGFEFQALRARRRAGALSEAAAAEAGAAASAAKAQAVKEYLQRLAAAVVKHLRAIRQWIEDAVRSLAERAMGPRRDWLARNKTAVLAARGFGDLEVDIGDRLTASRHSEVVADLARGFAAAARWDAGDQAFGDFADFSKTSASALEAHYIGKPERYAMTPALARQLVRVAEETFAALDELKGVARELGGAEAEARRAAASGEDSAAEVLRRLSKVSSSLSRRLSGAVTVTSRANAQAMGALVRALRAAEREEPARPANEAADPLLAPPPPGVLDAYLPRA